jgi:hypothetical protein
VNPGKFKLNGVDPEQERPVGDTWADAVTENEISAPLHTFREKDSTISLELPEGSGLGLISVTRFFNVSPKTESKSSSVLPVLLKL